MDGIRSLRSSRIRTRRLCNGVTIPQLEDIYIDKRSESSNSGSNNLRVDIIRSEMASQTETMDFKNKKNDCVALHAVLDKSKAVAEHNHIIDFDDLLNTKEQELKALKSKSTEDLKKCSYSDSPLSKYSNRLDEYSSMRNKKNTLTKLISNHKILIALSSTAALALILIIVFLNNK